MNSHVASWKTALVVGGERLGLVSSPGSHPCTGSPPELWAPLCLCCTEADRTPRLCTACKCYRKALVTGRTMLQRLMKSWEPQCQIPAPSRGCCLCISGPACLSLQVCSSAPVVAAVVLLSVARKKDTWARYLFCRPKLPAPPEWSVSNP